TGGGIKIRKTKANQPGRALRIVGDTIAAVAVIHGDGSFVVIGRLSISRPRPSVSAYLAGIVEVVQKPERQGQAVMVGRHGLWELGERGVAIATRQIPENLIVGLVFLNDVNHVIDPAVQEGHHRAAPTVGDAVILIDAQRKKVQGPIAGNRNDIHLRLYKRPWPGLEKAWIRGGAVRGVGTYVALECADVKPFAVATAVARNRDGGGIPAGRNASSHTVVHKINYSNC